MSTRALILATLAQLRKPVVDGGLAYGDKDSGNTLNGRPNPNSGDWFVSVHRGGLSGEQDLSLQEASSLKITISRRSNGFYDAIGPVLLEPSEGLDDRMDAIIAMMTNYQDAVRTAANQLIKGTAEYNALHPEVAVTVNGYVENLRFMGGDDDVTPRQGSWWAAEATETNAGVSVTLRFGLARRIQAIGSAT